MSLDMWGPNPIVDLSTRQYPQFVTDLLGVAEQVDVDLFPAAHRWHEHGQALQRQLSELPTTGTDPTRARATAVQALAAGGDLDASIGAIATATHDAQVWADAPQLLRDARHHAYKQAWSEITRRGDTIVTDMRPVVDAAVTEAVELAEQLPGRIDSNDKIRGEPQYGPIWARLATLHATWRNACLLADQLRETRIIPHAGKVDGYPHHFVPARHRYAGTRPLRWLRRSLADVPSPLLIPTAHRLDAHPGIYTAAEVLVRYDTSGRPAA